MGDVVPFPAVQRSARGDGVPERPPETVFQDRGWRILEVPSAGQFLALSPEWRSGVEVGRFDPRAPSDNHHGGSEIAILTRCAADERLARCAIGWLNADGPQTAILGAFVVVAGGRYQFWRDAIIEIAAIGGMKLVRLVDGSVAIAGEPEPVPLLDPFAALAEHRRRAPFDRLPGEIQAAVLRWADPAGQFGGRLDRTWSH